jgi:hypothetical protein
MIVNYGIRRGVHNIDRGILRLDDRLLLCEVAQNVLETVEDYTTLVEETVEIRLHLQCPKFIVNALPPLVMSI